MFVLGMFVHDCSQRRKARLLGGFAGDSDRDDGFHVSGVEAYLPEPFSRLSPSGARLTVDFVLPARIVTVPVAPVTEP